MQRPAEAAEIAAVVRAKIAIPYHYMDKSNWTWETFLVSHSGTAQDLAEMVRSKRITPVQLVPGQQLQLSGTR